MKKTVNAKALEKLLIDDSRQHAECRGIESITVFTCGPKFGRNWEIGQISGELTETCAERVSEAAKRIGEKFDLEG